MQEPRTWLGLSARAWVGAVVAVGLLAWLTGYLISLGPKKVDMAQLSETKNGQQWRLDQQIDEVEQRYRAIPVGGLPPVGMEDELTRAIDWQERLLQANPNAGAKQTQRLDWLTTARDTVLAQRMWPQIMALEVAVGTESNRENRITRLDELLKLRQEINRSRAAAQYKDLVRATQIERELEGLQAGPLRGAADDMITRAKKAADEKNWPGALDYYTRSRDMLEDINRRFPRSRYADIALAGRLKVEEQSLQGAGESAEIEVYVQGGEAAARDRPELAVEYYQQALEQQKLLNQRWPRSRFFSTSRLDELEEKLQTLQAGVLLARMREVDAALQTALASRQLLAASNKIAEAQAIAQRLKDEFPRNSGNDDGLVRKFTFLAGLGDGMRVLQDSVYDQLVPLRTRSDLMLLCGEVSQELYTTVMKFNPGRAAEERPAVTFVSWDDAVEFCRRLGWVLGKTVTLPTREVMQAALNDRGMIDPIDNDIESAYVDLRGGVSEWLADTPSANEAAILLGTVAAEKSGSPFGISPRDTRSRDIGFRIVVAVEVP